MISEVNRSVNPIGLFAGGTSISGGTSNPIMTSNFDPSESSSIANYPKGLPSSFSTSYSHGITDATIDKSTFRSMVNYSSTVNSGKYVFRSYENNGTKWAITSHPQSYAPTGTDLNNIAISDYGITLTGSVAVGEGLEIEYYQGEESSDYSVSVVTIIRTNYGNKFLVGDMNLIGYLGTLERYRRQFGGIRTYDAKFAGDVGDVGTDAGLDDYSSTGEHGLIDGYPKGSQLEYLQTITEEGNTRYIFRKVLSLIDDNRFNFVEYPKYIDNIHWMYCDVFSEDIPTLPSSDFQPIIIAFGFWVGNGSYSYSFTKTLPVDCYVSISTNLDTSYVHSADHKRLTLNIAATLNGKTSTMIYVAQNMDNVVNDRYEYPFSNGSLVRAGTTISARISSYHCVYNGFSVIAVPAIISSQIERL